MGKSFFPNLLISLFKGPNLGLLPVEGRSPNGIKALLCLFLLCSLGLAALVVP